MSANLASSILPSNFPPQTRTDTALLRFGPYEVDLASGQLRKFGYRVKLQPKSFLVLQALLQSPGEMVTREELKTRLWPENTFVEFESSLNVAVRRLREALSDDAQKPTYIETVPRRGYRFVGIAERIEIPADTPARLLPVHGDARGVAQIEPPVTQSWWASRSWQIAVSALVILLIVAVLFARNRSTNRRASA